LRLLHTVVVLSLLTASAAAAEKLIVGFETTELAAKKGKSWTTLRRRDDGCDFWAHFEYEEKDSYAWVWRCRRGDSTEGKQALVARLGRGRRQLTFRGNDFQKRHYPVLRTGSEARVLFGTFQWLAFSKGGLRDWSAYDKLWVDLKTDAPLVCVWLNVEDETIEPPVVRTFEDVPVGKWVTLELDLDAARRMRQLDLEHVTNVTVLAKTQQLATVRIDNVRVATQDVRSRFGVLRDVTPMIVTRPAATTKPVVPTLAKDYKPDRSPVKLEPPRTVAEGSVVPYGFIAAADNRYMLLACMTGRGRWRGRALMMQSADGGKTWDTLAAPKARNFDHGTSRGSVVDANGNAVAVSSGPGCAGIGRPGPRQHLTTYTFTGVGWERRRWASVLDADIRHCGSTAWVTRLPRGPKAGRLWASWGALDRMRRLVVHCRFSDDDGFTWWHVGKSALVPGSANAPFSLNSYSYQQPRITSFRSHAAVFWQDSKGLRWSRFDGSTWSPAETIDASATAKLDVSENESFRVPGAVVTVGEDEIFLTAWHRGGLYRYDGRTWHRELTDAADAGVLTVCGEKDVMLITMGSTEQPPKHKRIQLWRRAKLLAYRRKRDGTWAKPLDIAGGEVTLHEYRQMTAVVVPPMSPPNFAPVVFSDGETIRLVKVPVLKE